LGLVLSSSAIALDAEPRTVRVGFYDNSPKIFVGADGRAEGIFVDLVEAIAEHAGW
jgi:hypothetical protein